VILAFCFFVDSVKVVCMVLLLLTVTSHFVVLVGSLPKAFCILVLVVLVSSLHHVISIEILNLYQIVDEKQNKCR